MWRHRERPEETRKEGDTLNVAGRTAVATLHATNGNRELAAAIYRDAIEETSGHPKTQVLIYLEAAGVLYGNSFDPNELNTACETIAMALGLLGNMNGDPGSQELKELAVTAFRRAKARRAAIFMKLNPRNTLGIDDTVDEGTITDEIGPTPQPKELPIAELEVGGWPLYRDGTTTIVPGTLSSDTSH